MDENQIREAKKEIIRTGKSSASFLQRRFRLGYIKAVSILDILEKRGVIGPEDGASPRKILIINNRE